MMAQRLADGAPAWSLLLVALPAALAGCGEAPFVIPDQDQDGRYVVHLTGGNRFDPDRIQVPVNSTIVWIVEGGNHDVNEEEGRFGSSQTQPKDEQGFPVLLGPGERFAHRMNETGTFRIWCHTHHEEDMSMLVKVGAR